MKNGYELLITLTNTLNSNSSIIEKFIKEDKENFSSNEDHIAISIGIINEIKEIAEKLDEEAFILNKHLYDLLKPICNYANNLFNDYNIVNTYKLYDTLKIDIKALRDFLNKINN